jgi:outer membrane protein OmpA-like peptidoglycan-associated protein
MRLTMTIFLLFMAIFGWQISFGQNLEKPEDLEPVQNIQLKHFTPPFSFPNINKIPYYYNKKEIDDIRRLDQQKNWEELRKKLRAYVGKFGIQNFYRDTQLLWRLAKLTELYGDINEAIQLYKLVLKHHRQDIDIQEIEAHYETIKKEDINLYVPLEYYYELVDYRKDVDTLRPPRGVQLNMGALVNSSAADYGPSLAHDENALLFTSKRNTRMRGGLIREPDEDIFMSKKWGEFWSQAEPLKGINSQYNEGSPCISKDGKTLYFARCNAPDGLGNCDLYSATLREDGTWGDIKNLGPNVNSISWDSHPSLSHTEDTLYFASDRIGGFGLSDIWFTYKLPGGKWAPAQNAGPVINTRNNEVSPFYHPAHNILYFSSNGQLLNFGEFDIYKSYKTNTGWSDPINIGPLVNKEGTEYYFTIDYNSGYLFYARSEDGNLNNLDLYSFPLPMEAHPLATTKLTGTFADSLSRQPFKKGIVSIIDLDQGIEVAPRFLKEDGTFEFFLINNRNYLLIIQGEEFFRIEELFRLEDDMEINAFSQPISSKIKFQSIEFDGGKSDLKSEMFSDLYKVADFLIDNPDFKLIISGHTDSDGTDSFNMKLSEDRANNIRDFITHFGKVSPLRIESRGYGSTRPIVEEKTDQDKRLNRRVEFEIYRPAKDELKKIEEKVAEEEVKW